MARRDRLLLAAERARFVFTTHGEDAFEGVLVDWDESHYVIADVSAIAPDGTRTRADGEIWLPRPQIKYFQRL